MKCNLSLFEKRLRRIYKSVQPGQKVSNHQKYQKTIEASNKLTLGIDKVYIKSKPTKWL